jgi:hypothetical protein
MKVVRLSPLRTGCLHPQEFAWYSFLETESTPGHMVPSVASEKIPSDTTGDRSRDLPTSSAVPKPLCYPRPQQVEWNIQKVNTNKPTSSMEQYPLWEIRRSHMVEKFLAFYGTQKPTIALYLKSNEFSLHHPLSLRYILILSSHLCPGLPSNVFAWGFITYF